MHLPRDRVVEEPGGGVAVLGGADEGQISGAGRANWEHGAARTGRGPKVAVSLYPAPSNELDLATSNVFVLDKVVKNDAMS